MARTSRRRWGALATKQRPASADEDPAFTLFVAIVEMAQRDLTMPVRHCGGAGPTAMEQREAALFLDEIKQSAYRRTS